MRFAAFACALFVLAGNAFAQDEILFQAPGYPFGYPHYQGLATCTAVYRHLSHETEFPPHIRRRAGDKMHTLYENLQAIYTESAGYHEDTTEHVVQASHISLHDAERWLGVLPLLTGESSAKIPWADWEDWCDDQYLIPILQHKAELE